MRKTWHKSTTWVILFDSEEMDGEDYW